MSTVLGTEAAEMKRHYSCPQEIYSLIGENPNRYRLSQYNVNNSIKDVCMRYKDCDFLFLKGFSEWATLSGFQGENKNSRWSGRLEAFQAKEHSKSRQQFRQRYSLMKEDGK